MKAAILGYGKSGKSAEQLLKLKGYNNITIFDDNIANVENIADFKNTYDIVCVSPGIKLYNEFFNYDNITSEIELAYSLVKDKEIIVVTGTNGKSTVTHLSAQILNNFGLKAVACGNIGKTFTEAVLENKYDIFVLELSSFQIELLRRFKANAVCIVNISPDHLDRYSCYEEYVTSKYRITEFIRNDGKIIYNKGNEFSYLLTHSYILPIEIDENLKEYPKLDNNKLDFKKFYVDISDYNFFGIHNVINLAFALELTDVVADYSGDISYIIKNLTPLEHRCEFVGTIDNITYINDSKGTNVDSTLTALKSAKSPLILILGGKDKNGDFSKLIDLINEKVTTLYLIGDAKDKIYEKIADKLQIKIIKAENLQETLNKIQEEKKKDLTVLFSPACASFDAYKNFEERGKHFKELVRKMKEGVNV